MPELPEVETVRRGLEKPLRGRVIVRVTLARKGLRAPFPPALARLRGVKIAALRRRAKYLLLDLDDGRTMIVHLGMSGRLTVTQDAEARKHDHMTVTLDNGRRLVFNDARRFGLVALARTEDLENHTLFRHLGPEPLDRGFTPAYLSSAFAGRKAPVKTALMDQRIVVGVGNIYAAEALFTARIDPRRPAGSLTPAEIRRLVAAVRRTLDSAIAAGGSSLRDYVRADGSPGYFQHAWRVYGRAGEKCRGCACGGAIQKTAQAGRTTFYCPAKQL